MSWNDWRDPVCRIIELIEALVSVAEHVEKSAPHSLKMRSMQIVQAVGWMASETSERAYVYAYWDRCPLSKRRALDMVLIHETGGILHPV